MREESTPRVSRWDAEVRVLAWLAVWVSVFSFLFYFRRGDVLLYGDAVAHINIARRVFDSRTPGLLQLGTVWLPLPHLLMIPFLISNEMWQRGVGGSIPSMVAYVFGVIGMFRLMRGVLSRGVLSRGDLSGEAEPDGAARVAAWTAAAVYGANPNLIYMQSTAMGEALYLAFFIWAVVYFSEFAHGDVRALTKCGLCLAAGCLTRYDGWFLAVAMVAGAVVSYYVKEVGSRDVHASNTAKGGAAGVMLPSRSAIVKFVLIAAAAPALWFAYNGIVYRNPLEFENGPYSARAIEKRTQSAGSVGHPGTGNLYLAGLYFLKSAEANLAENEWLQRLWIVLAAGALIVMISDRRKRGVEAPDKDGSLGLTVSPSRWPLIFLLVPVLFYALSIAYGGVPIFIPAWWPFTHYNVRYGLQMLPAFAAAVGILAYTAARSKQWPKKWRRAALLGLLLIVSVSYGFIWRAGPVCYEEAVINMRSRVALERQVASWLHALPANATLLMDLGGHPGALEQAGIPLKRTINEGNHRVWMQPSDSEGLWERALANPAELADYALAFDGDDVWRALQGRGFKELVVIRVMGQPQAILYRVR